MGSSSVEKYLGEVHTKFKLNFYKEIFKRFEAKEGKLTAIETFCMEVIFALKNPTINQFSDFLELSQANGAYKVGKLVQKGYIQKTQSTADKRVFHISPTEKFTQYYNISTNFIKTIADRISKRFSPEELEKLGEMLKVISCDLMPEVAI